MPKAMSYTKGSIIYFSGDKDERIFILQKGFIVLTSTEAETGQTVTEYVKEGEFFGVKSALGRFPRDETATVAVDSSVISMSVPEFEQLFSSNKQVIMKMLKVFSKQLRSVHKKIESILGNGATVNLETGMISVAQSFYNDEQYRSCCDVCLKFLTLYPQSTQKGKIAQLYADSRVRFDKLQSRRIANEEKESDPSEKAFSLPAFSRFAKTFEPGSVIIAEYERGETFYLIQSGSVQLVKCVNDVRKNLDILHPGEFFGEMAILENSPRSATCVAIDKVEVLEFNKENFEILITGNPQMALILVKLFCKRIYDQKRRLEILVTTDPLARIAEVFLMFDEMNPVTNPTGKSRTFNLTVSDLVHWAGLTTEVVRDEINRLVEKDKIEVFDTHIVVKNISDMKRTIDTRRSQRVL
ncbi:MAG: Crp/Fnr family transcriptional regulator [Candidatus Treponema excrementipullorum]|uniref:Crp/Fnr family transcriptional regulator n=1 Tax=Candidatus Treponema excrementipullorum TaxID=2838768 RepID=A0A9E2L2T3_9SPIR|nr:Crp/Fnr family transcriptional regulator [Candidatus Treponema excrementipullorum]